jgi:hypothetical protein
VETGCRGAQGSPRAVAPTDRRVIWHIVNLYFIRLFLNLMSFLGFIRETKRPRNPI